jgi:arginine:pyruvate transaminase
MDCPEWKTALAGGGAAAAGHVRVALTVADEVFTDALARLLAFAQELAA